MDNSLHTTTLKNDIEMLPQGYFTNRRVLNAEEDFHSSDFLISSSEMSIHEDISKCLSSAKKSLPKGGDLTEMLTHMVSHLLRLYDKDREYYRILIQQMLFVPKNTNSLLIKLHQEQFAFVTYVIELSKSKKKVSHAIDAHQIATTIFFIYIGLLENFTSDSNMTVNDATQIFSSSISLLHKGIKRRDDEKIGNDLYF